MVFEELAVRLNDKGYKNWLKAGHCLRILKEGLHVFTNTEMRAFHGDLLGQHAILRRPCQSSSCTGSTRNKPSSVCAVCSEWRTVILRHHRQPNITVNWDNCRPSSWLHDHWEVAKAYMPRGQFRVAGADQCDASALLNLINHCDRFSSVDPKLVREVIRCRNELMHSCELRVEDEWMRHYQASLKMLLQRFNHVAEVASAAKRIQEMLVADWSVCVSRLDRVDAAHVDGLQPQSGGQWETGADSISQWEVELLQETLQELLHDTDSQHTEGLVRLKDFLQANRDLGEQFSAEIQALHSLGARGQGHQRTEEDEDETI